MSVLRSETSCCILSNILKNPELTLLQRSSSVVFVSFNCSRAFKRSRFSYCKDFDKSHDKLNDFDITVIEIMKGDVHVEFKIIEAFLEWSPGSSLISSKGAIISKIYSFKRMTGSW